MTTQDLITKLKAQRKIWQDGGMADCDTVIALIEDVDDSYLAGKLSAISSQHEEINGAHSWDAIDEYLKAAESCVDDEPTDSEILAWLINSGAYSLIDHSMYTERGEQLRIAIKQEMIAMMRREADEKAEHQ